MAAASANKRSRLWIGAGVLAVILAFATLDDCLPFKAHSLLEDFHSEAFKSEFISYATQVSGSNYLQFAQIHQMEDFTHRSSARVFWDKLQLPDVVVGISAPVEYTYYLDLQGDWYFEKISDVLFVRIPPIQYNRPALDVSKLKYQVKQGSVFRDSHKAMDDLRSLMSELLDQRARQNVSLVKELGRKKTEEFIAQWMKGFSSETLVIQVLFDDEENTLKTRQEAPQSL